MENICSAMWIALCIIVFWRLREWDKKFTELYDELTKEE